MEGNNMLKVGFYHTDEFGQTTKLDKTFNAEILNTISPFELLIDEFKYFLISDGFSQDLVNQIQVIDN